MRLNTLMAAGAVTAGILVIGWIGHNDRQIELETAMQSTCETSYLSDSGNLVNQCADLINAVQADNHHEVLSKDGRFWTEYHKEAMTE